MKVRRGLKRKKGERDAVSWEGGVAHVYVRWKELFSPERELGPDRQLNLSSEQQLLTTEESFPREREEKCGTGVLVVVGGG